MAKALINQVRPLQELKGNRLLIAIELAHRADNAGRVPIAYAFMAQRVHCCKRTAIRCIEDLCVKHGILRKVMHHTGKKGNESWAINTYIFTMPLPPKHAYPPHTRGGSDSRVFAAKLAPILPTTRSFGPKTLSLGEEIRLQKKALHGLTQGSIPYAACAEEIHRLEALQGSEDV